MKIKIVVLFGLFAFLTSCKDALDIKPEDRQSITNAFDGDDELMAFLISMQGEAQRLIGDDPHQYMGAPADRCDNTAYNNLRNLVPATVKSGLYSTWKEYYDVIYLANLMLENIYQAEGKLPQERINFYRGQALFLKGWMYLELGKIWGNAIITTGTNNFETYTNNKDYEVINEAIKNLEESYPLLLNYGNSYDDKGSLLTSKQYGSKGAVAGLLAHAYAWQGSMTELYNWPGIDARAAYTASVDWSTKVISGEASSPYALAPTIENLIATTFGSWQPANRVAAKESILEVQNYYLADFSGNYAPALVSRYTTWPVNTNQSTATISLSTIAFKFNRATVKQMYKGTDQRLNSYFYKVDEMASNLAFSYPYKVRKAIYRVTNQTTGVTSTTGLDCNDIFIRLADIYLLRAECYAKLGQDALAITDLNKIRGRATAALYPADATETDLKMAIFKEREKELLMESGRYYDVLRNGKSYIKTQLGPAFAALSDRDIADGALYMFIYTDAFVNNTILQQNIYWNRME
ncbi:RagB/SusD family nutrient uptake outer membrane protein [Pedobacter sp. MW01-1-1]|uniref:RagB/SusD family nutrient uptake outer membrane protein n=1 Tax=Pedobacter sp. MW01-1-1 TaxID=3383027 RepID=UPI003FF010CE